MKPRFSLLQLAIALLSFSFFAGVSCKKETSQSGSDTEQEVSASKTSGESDAQSEIVFNGVFDDVMGVNDVVGMAGTGVFGRVTACPTVTIVPLSAPNTFPVKIILDFGVSGCVGNDGHLRRGKIITEYTKRLIEPGAMATTIFDGFYFDSVKVEGTHKITNITNPQNTPVTRKFEARVENGKLSVPNGNYVTWNSIKVITQFDGGATNDPRDDAFKVEGTAQGTAKRGNLLVAWQSTITEPLFKRFNCRWIVKGRVRTVRLNTNVNSQWVGVLDFGAGNCDNQAVLTINGVSHQITLP